MLIDFQEPPPSTDVSGDLQVMNCDRLLILVEDIGQATTLRVIERSKIDFYHNLLELSNANQVQDYNALRIALHSIAGIAAMFGAEKLHSIAQRAEEKCLQSDFVMASRYANGVAPAVLEYFAELEKFEFDFFCVRTQSFDG